MILYVGGKCLPGGLTGPVCCSAAYHPPRWPAADAAGVHLLLDSGAYTDRMTRLSMRGALLRQFAWENEATRRWGVQVQAEALASYDRLMSHDGDPDAARRVEETVWAARYLASQRRWLGSRRLVLAVQGSSVRQYLDCTRRVLQVARGEDWVGLGGWCVVGRQQGLLGPFAATMAAVLPVIAAAGISRVHLFGVLWLPALGHLQWLCDRYGLEVSTDSSSLVLAYFGRRNSSVARAPTWQENVAWWRSELANLRGAPEYGPYPRSRTYR